IDLMKQIDAMKLRTPRPDFEMPPGGVLFPMDLKTGRRGVGPCTHVVMEAFVVGQEPDKDCSGDNIEVSKLPYYLQRAFYQPKDASPTVAVPAAPPQSGETAESSTPAVEEPTSTAPVPPPPPP